MNQMGMTHVTTTVRNLAGRGKGYTAELGLRGFSDIHNARPGSRKELDNKLEIK